MKGKKQFETFLLTGAGRLMEAASFVEDASGAIWMGFLGGGLSRYRAGRFTSLTEREGLPPGAIHLYIWMPAIACGAPQTPEAYSG